jgi:hypothetical protein
MPPCHYAGSGFPNPADLWRAGRCSPGRSGPTELSFKGTNTLYRRDPADGDLLAADPNQLADLSPAVAGLERADLRENAIAT